MAKETKQLTPHCYFFFSTTQKKLYSLSLSHEWLTSKLPFSFPSLCCYNHAIASAATLAARGGCRRRVAPSRDHTLRGSRRRALLDGADRLRHGLHLPQTGLQPNGAVRAQPAAFLVLCSAPCDELVLAVDEARPRRVRVGAQSDSAFRPDRGVESDGLAGVNPGGERVPQRVDAVFESEVAVCYFAAGVFVGPARSEAGAGLRADGEPEFAGRAAGPAVSGADVLGE